MGKKRVLRNDIVQFSLEKFLLHSHIHYINIGVISLKKKVVVYVSVFVPFDNFLDVKWRFIVLEEVDKKCI